MLTFIISFFFVALVMNVLYKIPGIGSFLAIGFLILAIIGYVKSLFT